MAPQTMKALVTGKRSWLSIAKNGVTRKDFSHGALVSESVPTPKVGRDEILVKVHAVAQNPTDWKHINLISPPHSIIGCDYAGEVAEIGPDVPPDAWRVGERVAGVAHGGLYPDQGAYAQYLRIPHDLAWKVPEKISDRDATTYGVSAVTAMMALYHNLAIPWPDSSSSSSTANGTIFIYAGSTCAGLFALQMARHAGWTAVTTCSPSNFALVKAHGAAAAYDYNSPTLVADVRAAHPGISRALDCFSEGASTSICGKVVSVSAEDRDSTDTGAARVVTLLPMTRTGVKGVEVKSILAYTLMGRPFQLFAPLGPTWKAVPEDRAALVRFYALLPALAGDWLRPPPVRVVDGGWDGLLVGLGMLKKGEARGTKLVVELEG